MKSFSNKNRVLISFPTAHCKKEGKEFVIRTADGSVIGRSSTTNSAWKSVDIGLHVMNYYNKVGNSSKT